MNLDHNRMPVNKNIFENTERILDCLQKPALFQLVKQIMVSHAKIKVKTFIDFDPYLHYFGALVNYTKNLV